MIATPITNFLAYFIYAGLVLAAIYLAQLPLKVVARRSIIEIPFVLFALLMPFFGTGKTFSFAGFELYEEGLKAGAGIIVKGTLGILIAIVLSSTTSARELLRGLERLKMPHLLVQIASFMLRYMNVVNDEMQRMKIARASRGFSATGIQHWRILAQSAGALFIRSYERGERVHLAMLARGYAGRMPDHSKSEITIANLFLGFSLPISAFVTLVITSVSG
jgi:cobalt/nickel transport system permease protein